MSLFKINIRTWILKYLPPEQRDDLPLVDLVDAWLAPLQDVFDEVDLETDKNIIRSKASGQPIKMRKALSLLTGINGITVTINRAIGDSFVYLESETTPQDLYLESEALPAYFNLETEGSEDFSFTVGVPAASFNPDVVAQIEAEILIFGLATSNFNIVAI